MSECEYIEDLRDLGLDPNAQLERLRMENGSFLAELRELALFARLDGVDE